MVPDQNEKTGDEIGHGSVSQFVLIPLIQWWFLMVHTLGYKGHPTAQRLSRLVRVHLGADTVV